LLLHRKLDPLPHEPVREQLGHDHEELVRLHLIQCSFSQRSSHRYAIICVAKTAATLEIIRELILRRFEAQNIDTSLLCYFCWCAQQGSKGMLESTVTQPAFPVCGTLSLAAGIMMRRKPELSLVELEAMTFARCDVRTFGATNDAIERADR
jgi:hypothetical protein